MIKLKADFKTDLIAHARRMLTGDWGPEIATIDNASILIRFFDAERRRIAARPRSIEIGGDFICPTDRQDGWNSLQDKIRKGEDLGPHMSKLHSSLVNNDGLLNEWGAHHFHLGIVLDHGNPSYIERTGPLVFALVDDAVFRAINVYQHQDWHEISIIESLHRYWPEAIRRYRLHGIAGEPLTGAQRGRIRRVGSQAAVTVQDGTVYGSIGGPVSFAGTKFDSVRNADRWAEEVRLLQAALTTDPSPLMPALTEAGYQGEEEIEAQLQIVDGRYGVFFPRYNRLVTLEVFAQSA